MSNYTFTVLPTSDEYASRRALFARKLAIAEALFATTHELNDIDIQPYVTTMHGEVCSLVRRIVADAIGGDEDLARSIVDHAFDSDIMTAARYVIEREFDEAYGTLDEAMDSMRDGHGSREWMLSATDKYNAAFDMLNSTVGPKAVK